MQKMKFIIRVLYKTSNHCNSFLILSICTLCFYCTKPLIATSDSQRICEVGDKLSIMSWNLGYAGLGAEEDFFADGGKNIRSHSQYNIAKNGMGICHTVRENQTDLYLFQEIAKPSYINYNFNLLKSINQELNSYTLNYLRQSYTVTIPWPLRIEVGNLIASKCIPFEISIHKLPGNKTGLFCQKFNLIFAKFRIANSNKLWVIGNVHKSAFDSNATIRKLQVKEIVQQGIVEYTKGNCVVIGGDWNLVPVKTTFPHTTAKKYLFWIFSFPKEYIPAGWHFYVDEKSPSVRTLQKSYVKNENYTTIIDGFLCSPNVKVAQVRTINQNFIYSAHNPVIINVEVNETLQSESQSTFDNRSSVQNRTEQEKPIFFTKVKTDPVQNDR